MTSEGVRHRLEQICRLTPDPGAANWKRMDEILRDPDCDGGEYLSKPEVEAAIVQAVSDHQAKLQEAEALLREVVEAGDTYLPPFTDLQPLRAALQRAREHLEGAGDG